MRRVWEAEGRMCGTGLAWREAEQGARGGKLWCRGDGADSSLRQAYGQQPLLVRDRPVLPARLAGAQLRDLRAQGLRERARERGTRSGGSTRVPCLFCG